MDIRRKNWYIYTDDHEKVRGCHGVKTGADKKMAKGNSCEL
jgi:hypothetical protein